MARVMKPYRHSVIVPCAHCGTPKRQWQADIDAGAGKYCSTKCQAEGQSRYPEILAALPGTLEGVAQRIGADSVTVAHAARRLCPAGRMHASSIVRVERDDGVRARSFAVVFSAGPSPFEVPPLTAREALTFFIDRMIVESMPGTMKKIVDKTGLPESTVIKRIREMKTTDQATGVQRFHIWRWKAPRGKGHHAAVYSAGPGKDAKQPPALSQKDRYAAWVKKLRKTGKIEVLYAKARERRVYRKIRQQTGDPLISALFGAPAQRRAREKSTTEGTT